MEKEKQVSSEEKKQRFAHILSILRYFLTLYKSQIGAPDNASGDFKLVGTQSHGSKFIYELIIEYEDKIEKRRMSVGPLGEDSGSKSMCYYAIYDDHIVIKIPPSSTTDFPKYIASINADRSIANQLAPKECVVPGLSVILKRIRPFSDGSTLSSMEMEERYTKLLQLEPSLQEYLQIDGSFVYFMDLSKHLMFSDVIIKMHKDDKKITLDEIINHFGNIQDFEGRYGIENETLCYDVKNIYFECESEIKDLMSKSKISSSQWYYKIHEWFSKHIADEEVEEDEKELSPDFVSEINALIRKKIEESNPQIESYRKLINGQISKKKFRTTKPQMMGVITNILELIAWLGEKKVSMRDLKPDNLLVIGEPSNYPLFLKFPEEFKLGLIDVETAVVYERKEDKIKQPQIGGTPFFATPTHLLKNKLIEATFPDLQRILHFQDWFASLVMMYHVITGERLFIQTARLFPGMKKKLKASMKNKKDQTHIAEKLSRVFWRSAVIEFKENMGKKEKLLDSVEVVIPQNAKEMLEKEILREKEGLLKIIQEQADRQKMFRGGKNRQHLMKADYNQISRFKTKFEHEAESSEAKAKENEPVIKFLQGLMKLKLQLEQEELILELFSKPVPTISSFTLLKLMFNIVLQTMYKREWGPFPSSGPSSTDQDVEIGVGDESVYGVTII